MKYSIDHVPKRLFHTKTCNILIKWYILNVYQNVHT